MASACRDRPDGVEERCRWGADGARSARLAFAGLTQPADAAARDAERARRGELDVGGEVVTLVQLQPRRGAGADGVSTTPGRPTSTGSTRTSTPPPSASTTAGAARVRRPGARPSASIRRPSSPSMASSRPPTGTSTSRGSSSPSWEHYDPAATADAQAAGEHEPRLVDRLAGTKTFAAPTRVGRPAIAANGTWAYVAYTDAGPATSSSRATSVRTARAPAGSPRPSARRQTTPPTPPTAATAIP